MINLDEQKLGVIKNYWRELCIVALSYAVVFLFQQLVNKDNYIQQLQTETIKKSQADAKYWRDAFITTAKYNKYLLIDSTKVRR